MTLNKDEYNLFSRLVKNMEKIEKHLEKLVSVVEKSAELEYPAISRQKEIAGKENG
jgi:hypothetical protein